MYIITFQDFNVGRNDSRIKLNGHYDLKEFLGRLNIAADNLDINEISQYAGLNLKGNVVHGAVVAEPFDEILDLDIVRVAVTGHCHALSDYAVKASRPATRRKM